jgi:hypothetical protein
MRAQRDFPLRAGRYDFPLLAHACLPAAVSH